jgi:nucleotide-binding universal stress UspA family protein
MASVDGAVLVGIDGSPDSRLAVTWAAHQARRSGVPLRIVHASLWSVLAERPKRCDTTWRETAMASRARTVLAGAVEHAREVEPEVRTDGELVYGDGPSTLTAVGADARLLVVGRRGLGTAGTQAVGDATATLAPDALAPIVVCGLGAEHSHLGGHDGPVVVGLDIVDSTDCSPNEHRLLDQAFELARSAGSALTVLHAWSDVDWGKQAPVSDYLSDWPTAERAATMRLDGLLGPWRERYPDVVVHLRIVDSRPAHALIEASDQASLTVVGSVGRRGRHGARFGSVARRVIAGAHSPVMVVPPG